MGHTMLRVDDVGFVVLKALLLYITAVVGFRVAQRRRLAEMSPFDFVVAIAVGAIVGRVPNADATGYVGGAATLVTLLGAHAAMTQVRRLPRAGRVIDPPPRVLVADGRPVERELRRAGVTMSDLFGLLRQHGVIDIGKVAYVILEQRGQTSVIRREEARRSPRSLVEDITERASAPS